MDLVKIGKYIAGKRKACGLTQVQLAEKLGMSNKSVSKWERGVCLPDVSVYLELCEILGITLNEFIAGEDLSEETVIPKSEENLLQVTVDGKKKQRKLKKTAVAFAAAAMAVLLILIAVVIRYVKEPTNYVRWFSENSTEMRTANLLAGIKQIHLCQYKTDGSYHRLTVWFTIYADGKEIDHIKLFQFELDAAHQEGILAITEDKTKDFDGSGLRCTLDCGSENLTTVLDEIPNETIYDMVADAEMQKKPVSIDKKQNVGILACYYDRSEETDFINAWAVQELADGEKIPDAKYAWMLSMHFEK